MAFIAEDNSGQIITAGQAEQGVTYVCPSCEGELSIRESHWRDGSFVSRHFWHSESESGSGCSGESDEHKRMKSIAVSKAESRWPNATVSWESGVGDRRADVLVEFSDRHHRFGEGIAIECQHKHEQKNIAGVTENFIEQDYSVLWLYEKHYSGKDVDFDAGDWVIWWVRQVPDETEWSGYHGVIHWLWQEKPTFVELEITVPTEPDEVARRWQLESAWEQGFKSRLKNTASVFIPCSRCTNSVCFSVRCSHKWRNGRWKLRLKGVNENRCSSCRARTKPLDSSISLTQRPDQPLSQEKETDSGPALLLPCPRCQDLVEFPAHFQARAEPTHPWADITIRSRSECSGCENTVELHLSTLRLLGRHF